MLVKLTTGLVVYDNFTGCIENMFIDFAKVSPAFNDPFGYKDNFNSYGKAFFNSQCFSITNQNHFRGYQNNTYYFLTLF